MTSRLNWTLLGLTLCGTCGLYGLWLGQDVNFDQANYHLYAAFALLHGRLGTDLAPAGTVHSFFNPLPYLPFYEAALRLPPRWTIALLGIWHGCNLVLVAAIGWLLTQGKPLATRRLLVACIVAISAASPMALAEMGGSFADITTSQPVLAGLALLLAAAASASAARPRRAGWLIFLGAGLVGMAIGLKLTNAAYAAGVATCVCVGARNWRERLRHLALAGAGGLCGVVATGGFWFLRLWRLFGNPVFPYYDAIFVSPAINPRSWLHGVSFADQRFRPHGLVEAVRLPFRWLASNVTTSEIPFRDVRAALLLTLVTAAAIWLVRGRLLGQRRPERPVATQRLLVFMAASFVTWMYQFSIQRYLVGLELLTGPALVATLALLLQGPGLNFAALGTAILCAVTVQPPAWGRIAPAAEWFGVRLPRTMDTAGVVFLQDNALSYLVPFMPRGTRLFGIMDNTLIAAGDGGLGDRRVRQALARMATGPVHIVGIDPISAVARQTLGAYGLAFDGPCDRIVSRLAPVYACRLNQGGKPALLAEIIAPGEEVRLDDVAGAAALLPGLAVGSGRAVLGAAAAPGLMVRFGQGFGTGSVRLLIAMDRPVPLPAGGSITVLANDTIVARWRNADDAAGASRGVCVPAALLGKTRDLDMRFVYLDAAPDGPVRAVPIHLTTLSARLDDTCGQFPDPAASPVAGPARKLLRVLDFGPTVATHGEPFNVQPDGASAIWLKLSRPVAANARVRVAGVALNSVVSQDTMSAKVPSRLLDRPGAIRVEVVEPIDGTPVPSAPVTLVLR